MPDPITLTPVSGETPKKPSKAPLSLTPLGGPESPGAPELRAELPWYVRYPEEAGRMVGFGLGALVGAPAGAAAGPLGVPAGTAAGAALGGTAADAAIAKFNERYYGIPAEITLRNLKQDVLANLTGAAAGEVAGPLLGRALVGKGALEAQATEQATQAQEGIEGFQRARSDAEAAAGQNIEKLEKEVTARQAPAAKAAIAGQETGRAPEVTAQALESAPIEVEGAYISGPGRIARVNDPYTATREPYVKMRESFDKQYGNLFGPHRDKPIPADPLGSELSQLEADLQERGVELRGQAKQLHDRAQELLKGNPEKAAAGEAELLTTPGGVTVSRKGRGLTTGYILAGKTPEQIAEILKQQPENVRAAMEAKLAQQGFITGQPTVGQLLQLESDAKAFLRKAQSGPDARVARRVINGVRASLGQSNIPGAQALHTQYRNWMSLFGDDFWSKVARSKDPTDYAPDLFNQPERAKLVIANASPEQRKTLLGLYGDWVNREGTSVIKPEHAAFLKALAPGSRLSKPAAWIYDKTQEARLEDVLGSSERVRQQFTDDYVKGIAGIKDDLDRQTVKDALVNAKSLGPLGKRITAEIKNARTPEQQADIAIRAFTGMNARDAAIEFIKSPEFGKSTPNWIQRRLPIYASVVAVQAARGSSASGYMAGMAALGGLDLIRSALRRGYIWSVRNNPDAWFDAISNVGQPGRLSRLAQMSARAAVDEGVSRVTQREAGLSDLEGKTPAPATTKTNATIKAADDKRAETIAGPHAPTDKIDAIRSVSKKVGKPGKPADVHGDLSKGRVSLGHVRKMLDASSGTSLASVFQGLSPQDAIGTLAQASPQEREALLPALAQHLSDSSKNMTPPQQQVLLAQLKAVMQRPEEATA